MTVNKISLEWAIDFVNHHSDGDLFPKSIEIESIVNNKDDFTSMIANHNLNDFLPGSCRRFIVPKDEVSYRQATQLDPQDSIILSALVYEYGNEIEKLRLSDDVVFSYRFSPNINDGLYSNKKGWNDFWTKAEILARSSTHILYCDIADFYNQIYHHTVENQLISAGWPNQAIKWLISLLESTTAGVSRGVPVGPHPIHLIAEATLIPVDNSLNSAGYKFIRYADDILIFCKSEKKAKFALSNLATILDRQQRLTLQRHKTKILKPVEFFSICREMIEDRPINNHEASLLSIIKKYSGGNPYKTISYAEISTDDWSLISNIAIEEIVNEYINSTPVDYIRLRWFYRRIAQIGHPGAINVSLENLEKLEPCFANICFYLGSIQTIAPNEWKKIGTKLLKLYKLPEVQSNEYFRLLILSVFSKNSYINHFSKLRELYQKSDPFIRREIILAAKTNRAYDWVRELKEHYPSMDPWQQRAMIYAVSGLAKDEKKYFLQRVTVKRPFEMALSKWSKNI
ncbi:RNA-directed DNA polymerase [Citrobacter sp. Cm046]|uniref:RNA-directed DNA polymerase n=1 Tax=Citrobacter sp. Cm046 TaxID=2985118 RepID=UPI002576915B|nr:RNA-directed DNA polymerase [Citrobacter sp. Cm046]MDM2927869.1 RNA-directed DNA polymerase [Citrobacter sp. Cm046]